MVSLNSLLSLLTWSYVISTLILSIVSAFSSTIAYYVSCFILPRLHRENRSSSDERTLHRESAVLGGVFRISWSLLVRLTVVIVQSVYAMLPLLLVVVIWSLLQEVREDVTRSFVNSYNYFMANNLVLQSFQKLVWLVKIFIELFAPLYNLVVDFIIGSPLEIINIVITSEESRVSFFGIFKSLGSAMSSIAGALYNWMLVNFQCSFENIVEDPKRQEFCLDHGSRDLDITSTAGNIQAAVLSVHLLIDRLCPAFSVSAAVLLYPAYDAHLYEILQHLINLYISMFWTVWDITRMRCNIALRKGLSATLCVPNVAPLSHYVQKSLHAAGLLIDNWLNWVNIQVTSIYFERGHTYQTNCGRTGSTSDYTDIDAWFSQTSSRPVRLTNMITAVTNGSFVKYVEKSSTSTKMKTVSSYFDPAVYVGYGLAGVDFGGDILDVDNSGDTHTGILGCSCLDIIDSENKTSVSIQCGVALYPGIFEQSRNYSEIDTVIPVLFPTDETADLLSCRSLRIAVEPISFNNRVGTFAGDTVLDSTIDCATNPAKCNLVDAAIYVMPLCPRYSDLKDRDKTECITNSKYQTCYPFCVGLHQKRAGNTPIILRSERSMLNGVFLANIDCAGILSSSNADVATMPMTMSLYSTSFSSNPHALYSTSVDTEIAHVGQCTSSRFYSSQVQDKPAAQRELGTVGEVRKLFMGYDDSLLKINAMSGEFQPYIFAGDTVFTRKCTVFDGVCRWTSTMFRITSDRFAQYRLLEIIDGIPSSGADIDIQETSKSMQLPQNTIDILGRINAAAQTKVGVFYAINPNLLQFESLMQCVADPTKPTTFQIYSLDSYSTPTLWLASPMEKCAKGSRMQRDGISVSVCSSDMLQQVKFQGIEHEFWVMEDYCGLNRTYVHRNLFFEDISSYDDNNVLAVVRRGPVSEYYYEAGFGKRSAREYETRESRSVYYFIDVHTLKIQRDIPWSSTSNSLSQKSNTYLCPNDLVMPPLGSLMSSIVLMPVKFYTIIINEYILNVFGVLEGIISRKKRCLGENLYHHAFEFCVTTPLSMRSLYEQLVVTHALYYRSVMKIVLFVGTRMRIPMAINEWAVNAAGGVFGPQALLYQQLLRSVVTGIFGGVHTAGLSIAAFLLQTMYFLLFIYNEIIVVYFYKLIRLNYSTADLGSVMGQLLLLLGNTVYESIESGAMRDSVFHPVDFSCRTLSLLSGDDENALGEFVLHSCLSMSSFAHGAIQGMSSFFTLSIVAACLCDVQSRQEYRGASVMTGKCAYQIPETMWAPLLKHFAYQEQKNQQRITDTCNALVDNFQTILVNVFTPAFRHADAALDALIHIPPLIGGIFQIPGMHNAECTTMPDIEVTTIVPKPVSSFRMCAYTPTCRSKCNNEISLFYRERDALATPDKPPLSGNVLVFVPMQQESIAGLSDVYEPLAIQDYGSVHGCHKYMVVVGRSPVQRSRATPRPWSMYFLCFSSDGLVISLKGSVLFTETANFHLLSDQVPRTSLGPESRFVHAVMLPPVLDNNLYGLFVVVLSTQTDAKPTMVYEAQSDIFMNVAGDYIYKSSTMKNEEEHNCFGLHNVIQTTCRGQPYNFESAEDSITIENILLVPNIENFGRGYGIIMEFMVRVQCGGEGSIKPVKSEIYFDRVDFTSNSYSMCRIWQREAGSGLLQLSKNQNTKILSTDTNVVILYVSENDDSLLKMEVLSMSLNHTLSYEIIQTHSVVIEDPSTNARSILKHAPCRMKDQSCKFSQKSYMGVKLQQSPDTDVLMSVSLSYRDRLSSTQSWMKQLIFWLPDSTENEAVRTNQTKLLLKPYTMKVKISSGIATTLNVEANRKCDYMSCRSCATNNLQRVCYAAQNCAVAKCVGTVLNTNNFLCVTGSVFKEIIDLFMKNLRTFWFAIVETFMIIFRVSLLGADSNTLQVETVSELFVTTECEAKDIITAMSALIPSFAYNVYSIIRNVMGSNSILDISTGSTSIVQSVISPANRIQNTHIIVSFTEFIASVAIYFVHVFQVFRKALLCLGDSIFMLTGGFATLVNHDTSSRAMCLQMTETISDDGDAAQTDQEQLNDLVRKNTIGTHGTHVSVRSPKLNGMSFIVGSASTLVSVGAFPFSFNLILINQSLDYILGIMHGLSGLMKVFEPPSCQGTPTDATDILQCVCGDSKYQISSVNRALSLADGGWWCTGVLKMFDTNGKQVYVYNPYSFKQLSDDLNTNGKLYLQCLLQKNEQLCDKERKEAFESGASHDYSGFIQLGISPLAVLSKCRSNYAQKTWDPGMFAVFNRDVRGDVTGTGSIQDNRMQLIYQDIFSVLSDSVLLPVVNCLESGPLVNTIQSCMTLYFGLKTPATSAMSHFVYEEIPSTSANTAPDACKFLGDNSLLDNHAHMKSCFGEDAMSECMGKNVHSYTQCSVSMSTQSNALNGKKNVIDTFVVDKVMSNSDITDMVNHKYENTKKCATEFIKDFKENKVLNIAEILERMSLDFISGEGDIAHQITDCIFMGAYNYSMLLPADLSNILYNMTYSRHPDGHSRQFEAGCTFSKMTDTLSGDVVDQKTCGTPTRKSIMAYITHTLLKSEDTGVTQMIRDLIQKQIEQIEKDVQDISQYGCVSADGKQTGWEFCCKNAGNCVPGESDFESNLTSVNLFISPGDITTSVTKIIEKMHAEVLHNSKVLSITFTPHTIQIRTEASCYIFRVLPQYTIFTYSTTIYYFSSS